MRATPGIGASGNINIAAAHVIGIDNINFAGTRRRRAVRHQQLERVIVRVFPRSPAVRRRARNPRWPRRTGAKETGALAQTALSWLDVLRDRPRRRQLQAERYRVPERQKERPP